MSQDASCPAARREHEASNVSSTEAILDRQEIGISYSRGQAVLAEYDGRGP